MPLANLSGPRLFGWTPPVALTGMIFPKNGDAGDNVLFSFTGSNMPNIAPLAVFLKCKPEQQTGFNTNFFHGSDGTFVGDNTYFGCHQYPQGGSGGTVHNWEVSANGQDDITDDNANSTVVVVDEWYSQCSIGQNLTDGQVEFYWNLGVGLTRIITYVLTGFQLVNAPSPALTFGDAPWSLGNERLGGVLRGIIILQSVPSTTHILALQACEYDSQVIAYCLANGLTLWYLNMNPTPSDIGDKSGAGHHPAFIGAGRPELWEA